MSAAADFESVMRRGVRSGRRTVIVYLGATGDASGMAGFAVSRAVGGAVVRNRVKRRLRAIMSDMLPTLPAGMSVVIRALPPAADAGYSSLRSDVASALGSAGRKVTA